MFYHLSNISSTKLEQMLQNIWRDKQTWEESIQTIRIALYDSSKATNDHDLEETVVYLDGN